MSSLGLFEGFGVELEYMIVDAETMAVRPFADRLLVDDAGTVQSEIEHGDISWSNELVSHVLEFKTTEPASSLSGLEERFATSVKAANRLLEPLGCTLLGTGAHPTFDPLAETVIWPGEYTEVYQTYDRIFGVRGHGWANLQSVHLNLPFANDEEFGRLHAAIRLLLPLIPALAASSPYLDGRRAGHLDERLHVYRHNQDRLPALVGQVVPEAVFTEAEYETAIFQPVLAALAPHDPNRVLKKHFANSRGAIARFDRGSVEIRLIDIQEYPAADLAIVAIIVAVLRALMDDRWISLEAQQSWDTRRLATILDGCIAHGEAFAIKDELYTATFGVEAGTAGEVWRSLFETVGGTLTPRQAEALDVVLRHGTLATRLVRALGAAPGRADFRRVYQHLASCLDDNRAFIP